MSFQKLSNSRLQSMLPYDSFSAIHPSFSMSNCPAAIHFRAFSQPDIVL